MYPEIFFFLNSSQFVKTLNYCRLTLQRRIENVENYYFGLAPVFKYLLLFSYYSPSVNDLCIIKYSKLSYLLCHVQRYITFNGVGLAHLH